MLKLAARQIAGGWFSSAPANGQGPTDAYGDGETGPFDLATLLGCWGSVQHGTVCVCLDADESDNIGAFELAILLGSWGPCP